MEVHVHKCNLRRYRSAVLFKYGVFLFVLISCNNSELGFKNELLENYTLSTLNDWVVIRSDTLIAKKIYDSNNDMMARIARIAVIEEVDSLNIWVADPLRGYIIEMKNNSINTFNKVVFKNGNGPSEVIRPSAIHKNDKESSEIYVLDSEQGCLIIVDREGTESERRCSSNIPTSMMSVNIKVVDNYLYLNTLQDPSFTILELGKDLSMRKGISPRIVPIGYQPITHNHTVFDLDNKSLVFSYRGLPFLFNRKIDEIEGDAVNLIPDLDLSDYNVSLEPKNEKINVGVNNVIRDVFLVDEKVYLSLYTTLYVLDFRTKSYKKVDFINSNYDEIKFHMMYASSNNIYLVDQFHNMIYKISKNAI